MLATQQRLIYARVRQMAFLDPVVHMPNLRALSRALNGTSWSTLCFLRIPELGAGAPLWGTFANQYKQMLANHLRTLLQPNEAVYHLAGHDLVFRLNSEGHQARIHLIDRSCDSSVSTGTGSPAAADRHELLQRSLAGQASVFTAWRVEHHCRHVVSQRPSGKFTAPRLSHVQQDLKDKVVMMNRILKALEHDHFVLMAQPIQGIRGDRYHEVLVRMEGESGELTGPNEFLPVAHEFGLSTRVDQWVIEHTLAFMDANRRALPGLRLAINLSPVSLSRSQFPQEVEALLQAYNIEPWQIIFELTENYALSNPELVCQTLEHLRALGCRVAIDDFGTGYASYARLKTMNVDILKIDGSFIRNLLASSLDYQVVDSICRLARMKNMQVVAEYVESPEIRQAVITLGIDYMQGYDIGVPVPLTQLAEEMTG